MPGDQKDRKLKGEKEERRGNTRNISPHLAFLQNTESEIFCSFLDVVLRILLSQDMSEAGETQHLA